MPRRILKFGGTSVGNPTAIERAVELVAAQALKGDQVVVVVSAMAGITDQLICCAEQAINKKSGGYSETITSIHQKFSGTFQVLIYDPVVLEALIEHLDVQIKTLRAACVEAKKIGFITPKLLDRIASIGELITIELFSAKLNSIGIISSPVDSRELILTDNAFTRSSPIQPDTDLQIKQYLQPMLGEAVIPIVSGYIGATREGEVTTLGRGGSDYTAAIIGAALSADQVWIYTDVNGVMTTDPEDVSEARLINSISYEEVFELAHFGARVLHPKTILPLRDRDIPIVVKNTFNPQGEGTLITASAAPKGASLKAVAGIKQLHVIAIKKRPGEDSKQIIEAGRIGLAEHGVEVLRAFQKSDRGVIYLAVEQEISKSHLTSIEAQLSQRLSGRSFPRIDTLENLSMVTAVGNHLLQNQQLVTRLNLTLDRLGISNFSTGLQTSQNSMSFLVPESFSEEVLRHFHREVIRYAAI